MPEVMIADFPYQELDLGIRDGLSFSCDYWRKFLAAEVPLDRLYCHAEVVHSTGWLLKRSRLLKAGAYEAGTFGNSNELFYQIPTRKLGERWVQKILLAEVWYRHPGKIFFVSDNDTHWSILTSHYEEILGSEDDAGRFPAMKATRSNASGWARAIVAKNANVRYIWWFLWDGDTAGALRRLR